VFDREFLFFCVEQRKNWQKKGEVFFFQKLVLQRMKERRFEKKSKAFVDLLSFFIAQRGKESYGKQKKREVVWNIESFFFV
jgi:hypothetical protein